MNHELPDVQAGFRKGRGTRDQIANTCWIIEKAREFQRNIYFCFIDYANAFDCVDYNKLWKILKEIGIPDHLTYLLRNLYAGQEATVRTGQGTTDWFQIGKGVLQGSSDYYAFNNAYGAVFGAFISLAQAAVSIARIKPILEMTEPILKTCPEEEDGKEILTELKGDIELSHVSFRYEDSMPYVLNDLNLRIKAGGICGHSRKNRMRQEHPHEDPSGF